MNRKINQKVNCPRSRNKYYYRELGRFFYNNIPAHSSVLAIGDMASESSLEIVYQAKLKQWRIKFFAAKTTRKQITGKFDYIVIADKICYFKDVQQVLSCFKKNCYPSTRIIITSQNFFWSPLFRLAEFLKLKQPSRKLNWLNLADIINLLEIESYEPIRHGFRLIFPWYIPIISSFMNRYLSHLPLLDNLGLMIFIVARPRVENSDKKYSVSVIVPARNEKGNIRNIIKRIPKIGRSTEIIFVEGGSDDGTLEEIKKAAQAHKHSNKILYTTQAGKGKGDAVRRGFKLASGEILMILDADMTVSPEDLPKFYQAIASGKAELANGSRLVYPLEKESMQTLNIIGNRFFSIMFTWLLGQKIKDTLCGTKVLFKDDYLKLARNRHFFGNFDPFGDFDLIFGAARLNLKITDIPIRYRARSYGITNISRFKHGWLLFKMMCFAMHKLKFT